MIYCYRQNYGYPQVDDAMSWFFLKTLPQLDAEHQTKLNYGKDNPNIIARVSVTIKYTTEFVGTLGVFFKPGLNMVAAWTIDVND